MCEVRDANFYPFKRYGPDLNFALFVQLTLTLPKITSSQSHDTPLDHKQYVCAVRTANVHLKKPYGPDNNFLLFTASDIDLARIILSQGHDTPSGLKQALCEVGAFLYKKEWTGHEFCTNRRTDRQGDSNISPKLIALKHHM